METVEALTKRRDDAEGRLDGAIRAIPEALVNGRDVDALRRDRARAAQDAADLEDAIALAQEAEAAERAAADAEAAAARERRVRELRAERLEAARRVDDALAVLEAAVARYQAVGRELGHETGSGAAIARRESQNMRWGIWATAERTADLLNVPFANGRRRRTLSQMEERE